MSRDGVFPRLTVLLTMDWEGTDLYGENLECLKDFQQSYGLPLLHFLNPAYYTAGQEKPRSITEKIRAVVGEADSLGLHLHAAKHLVEAAGIDFRDGPTFSRRGKCVGRDEGIDVMLHSYLYADLERLIGFSKDLLQEQGFANLKGFRAGGWMADSTVCECLKLHGFEFDSSATAASLLNGSFWEADNLQRYIDILWSEISLYSQAYSVQTSFGSIQEVPNNFGAIDYWGLEGVDFFASTALNGSKGRGEFYAVVNAHQETAAKHWPKLENFVDQIQENCWHEGIELNFVSDPCAATVPSYAPLRQERSSLSV